MQENLTQIWGGVGGGGDGGGSRSLFMINGYNPLMVLG